jgi:hypothetical protein
VGIGPRGVAALALGLAALVAGGCAARSADWVFEVRAANAPSRVPPGADDTILLNLVASVITHDLRLPLPAAVPAVAYGDEASFTAGLERRGVGPIYGQAFLAVDWLVERYTEDRLHGVFRSFGKTRHPHPSSVVSPLEYPGFVAEFRAYLETLR